MLGCRFPEPFSTFLVSLESRWNQLSKTATPFLFRRRYAAYSGVEVEKVSKIYEKPVFSALFQLQRRSTRRSVDEIKNPIPFWRAGFVYFPTTVRTSKTVQGICNPARFSEDRGVLFWNVLCLQVPVSKSRPPTIGFPHCSNEAIQFIFDGNKVVRFVCW